MLWPHLGYITVSDAIPSSGCYRNGGGVLPHKTVPRSHNHIFALFLIIQNVSNYTTPKTVLSGFSASRGGASVCSA